MTVDIMYVRPMAGQSLRSAITDAIPLAIQHNCSINLTFNDKSYTIEKEILENFLSSVYKTEK